MRPLSLFLLLTIIAFGSCAYRITADFEPGEFEEGLRGTFHHVDNGDPVWIHVGRLEGRALEVTQVRFVDDGGTGVSRYVATKVENLPVVLLDPVGEGSETWGDRLFALRYGVGDDGFSYSILDPKVIKDHVEAGTVAGTVRELASNEGDSEEVVSIDEDLNGWRRIAAEDRFWTGAKTVERIDLPDREEPAGKD